MRYAIIGDIHANLAALEAVLEDIERQGGADKVWHLGDVVGYGPDPGECIELIRRYDHISVAGNHDWAASGKIGTDAFNPDAAAASHWAAAQLSLTDKEYIDNLPQRIEEADFTLVHGSPREPIWEYLISVTLAGENFAFFDTPFCLVGHSHMPLVYSYDENGNCSGSRFWEDIELVSGGNRLIINPGAVGQPRDGNPLAAYAIYDSSIGMISPFRVSYDISKTQDKMKAEGLPVGLWTRLSLGV